MTLSDGTNSYAVSRSSAAGPIYVAIQPTTSADITVTATDGTNNYTKSLTGKTYAANNGYSVSWKMILTGAFTINSSGTQVKFAPGNLRYASGAWSFFDNQWEYYTEYSTDLWDKFGWSTSATTYGKDTSTSNSTYSGDFKDWGDAVGSGHGFRHFDKVAGYVMKTVQQLYAQRACRAARVFFNESPDLQ